MDIHLPRPAHGWRAFIGEVGTIVLGIGIALAAAQTVEALHWSRQVSVTRQRLHGEIADNLTAAAERRALQPCLRARIAALRDALVLPGPNWAASADPIRNATQRMLPKAYAAPWRPLSRGVWEAAVSSTALNHMSQDEAAGYAKLYTQTDNLVRLQEQESSRSTELASLSFPQSLSASDRRGLLVSLAEVDAANQQLDVISDQFLQRAQRMGIRPAAPLLKSYIDRQTTLHGACVQVPAGRAAGNTFRPDLEH